MNETEDQKLKELVGENVRRLRQRAGMSQDELAERACIHRTYLVRLEGPERANITLDVLESLAEALDVDPRQLLAASQPDPDPA